MYKVLIVDDEAAIRVGIENALPWEQLGIAEVKTAAGGNEALEIFTQFQPDLVLTDIRMPGMSGLELMEQVKAVKPEVIVIILSGFDDFGYARSALKLGAFDYLLKTADLEELTGVISKALSAIKSNKEREVQLDKSLPLLRQKYLHQLLYHDHSLTETYQELNQAGLILKTPFIIGVAELDVGNILEDPDREKEDFLSAAVLELAGKELGEEGICFEGKNEELIWICYGEPGINGGELRNRLVAKCRAITELVRSQLAASLSIGISNLGNEVTELRFYFEQARQALDHRLFTGKGSLILFDEIADLAPDDYQIAPLQERKLLAALRVGDERLVLDTINGIFEDLWQRHTLRVSDFQQCCSSILNAITPVLQEYQIDLGQLVGRELRAPEGIKRFQFFAATRQCLLLVFEKIAAYILNNKILKNKRVIEQAKEYINQHYPEDLTLNQVAEAVFMSPNYLSSLFSSETGESFLEYLTGLRIEKAKQLLGAKDAKAFEVGALVGYDNPQYFSKIFKRSTGMTPSEYREHLFNGRK